jgi:hypothetical protein
MSFIRIKVRDGTKYYYLVESVRIAGKVHQKLIRYFGKELPSAYLTQELIAKIKRS